MTVKLPQHQQSESSSDEDSVENSSSSGEEETDSETEPVVVSKKVETSSKPKTMANSSSLVASPRPADSKKVVTSKKRSSETDEGEAAKRVKRVSGHDNEKKNVQVAKIVETSSKPKTTSNSLSGVETDSPVVKLIQDRPTASSSYEDASSSEEEEEEETDLVPDSKKVTNQVVKPPADSSSKVEAKRVKRVSGDEDKKSTEQETKKNYFQRVWTEEDEIAVLQGIIDYKNETGSSPFDDKNALYELLKKSISFNASKLQFLEKNRSLKKKFDNNLCKWQKKGEEPTFSKPHDLNAFHLSKFVWGNDGIMANEPAVLKLVGPKREFVSIVDSMARFSDKKRLEEEWEALQLEELRFYSRKSRFIYDAVTKMAEASQQDR
ncbi:hypothetical protein N665_0338s0031 [Sinapis alba]|nr:hypothetical protein N665_0338s0031 [Sinapis alba]